MKTFNCTANESVSRYMTYTVKDDISLQFSLYYEIRKQHSNVIRLLVTTLLNGIQNSII